jgi:hypothetical protein
MAEKDTIIIPGLGEIRGTYDPKTKTTKFLGIPYGSLSKRWTRATALAQFPEGKHDGTKFGYENINPQDLVFHNIYRTMVADKVV